MSLKKQNSAPLPVIEPLENVPLSASLDGSVGTNRASGNHPQIAANTDIDAIKAWLARFIDTKTTFDNYRKEAERLLLWSTMSLQKPVSSLTHEDLLSYQHFLTDPQPAQLWVMQRKRKVAFLPADASIVFKIIIASLVFLIESGWYTLVALVLSSTGPRNVYLRWKAWIDRTAGGVMVALGIKLVTSYESV